MSGRIRGIVDVHFDDFDFVTHAFADFFQDRAELAAGPHHSAPKSTNTRPLLFNTLAL